MWHSSTYAMPAEYNKRRLYGSVLKPAELYHLSTQAIQQSFTQLEVTQRKSHRCYATAMLRQVSNHFLCPCASCCPGTRGVVYKINCLGCDFIYLWTDKQSLCNMIKRTQGQFELETVTERIHNKPIRLTRTWTLITPLVWIKLIIAIRDFFSRLDILRETEMWATNILTLTYTHN